MKKSVIFIIVCLLLVLDGCEKSQTDFQSISIMKAELKSLANSKVDKMGELDPCNPMNPFDAWGGALFIGMTKVSQTKSVSGSLLIYNQNEFIEKLKLEIPQEYLHVDTINVNMKNVESLCGEFLSLFVNRNVFESLQLSKKMENYVNRSKFLKEVDKTYILKFVSLIRYSTYFNYTLNNLSKGSFETCWKRELQKIEDMGFFSRAACVIDWPMCLGAVAADCLWEKIST